jgi:hypothetical protein
MTALRNTIGRSAAAAGRTSVGRRDVGRPLVELTGEPGGSGPVVPWRSRLVQWSETRELSCRPPAAAVHPTERSLTVVSRCETRSTTELRRARRAKKFHAALREHGAERRERACQAEARIPRRTQRARRGEKRESLPGRGPNSTPHSKSTARREERELAGPKPEFHAALSEHGAERRERACRAEARIPRRTQ